LRRIETPWPRRTSPTSYGLSTWDSSPGGGYVDPHQAADELLANILQPYLDDLDRRAQIGARTAATEIGLGLYSCRDEDDDDRVLTHAGMPDAVDNLASQVISAMTTSGLQRPEGWLAAECPEWRR
jgi:hypothetical protein